MNLTIKHQPTSKKSLKNKFCFYRGQLIIREIAFFKNIKHYNAVKHELKISITDDVKQWCNKLPNSKLFDLHRISVQSNIIFEDNCSDPSHRKVNKIIVLISFGRIRIVIIFGRIRIVIDSGRLSFFLVRLVFDFSWSLFEQQKKQYFWFFEKHDNRYLNEQKNGPIFLCETNIVENQAGFCFGERHVILILRSCIILSLESPTPRRKKKF